MLKGHSSVVSPAKIFARPTADHIWLGPAQLTALSHVSRETPLSLLVGPPSSGKSTLLAYLRTELKDAIILACPGPKNNPLAVLGSLLLAAGLEPWDLNEVDQRNLLTLFIQQRRHQNKRVLIVVDDAQHLHTSAWHEIERLRLLKSAGKPLVEIVLSGPVSLGADLGLDPETARMATHTLRAASVADITSYVEWRLDLFDLPPVFAPAAVQLIQRASKGRYTSVNVACQMALLLLRNSDQREVNAELLQRALDDLGSRRELAAAPTDPEDTANIPQFAPPAYVLISHEGKVLDRVELRPRTLLGRSEHNDIYLPSPYLSRHHALVVGTAAGYYVVDLNSTNGIQLNGERVERAVLCHHDIVSIGPFRLKVQIPNWLVEGDPLPSDDASCDTAVLPQQRPPGPASAIRRVK